MDELSRFKVRAIFMISQCYAPWKYWHEITSSEQRIIAPSLIHKKPLLIL